MSGHCPICGNWGDECCCDTLRDEFLPVLIAGGKGHYVLTYRDSDTKGTDSEIYTSIVELLQRLQELLCIGGWK